MKLTHQELQKIEEWRTIILKCLRDRESIPIYRLTELADTAESACRLFTASYAKDLLTDGFSRQNIYFWDDMKVVLERMQKIASKATVIAETSSTASYEKEVTNRLNQIEASLCEGKEQAQQANEDVMTKLNSVHRRLDGLKNNGKVGKRIGPEEQEMIYGIWQTFKKQILCSGRKTYKEDVWKNETAQRKLRNLGVNSLIEFEKAINAHEKALAKEEKLKKTRSRG